MSDWQPGRYGRLFAVLGLLLLALAFQGSRGLWDPDEGRYSNVALEMLDSGDWLRPKLYQEHPHYTKPPLTYWAIAASIAIFGHNEWAVRMPYAAAFSITVLLVYGLGKQYQPQRPWLPALVYATSILPFAASNIVTTDSLLALWETLAVFGFLRAYDGAGQTRINMVWMWLGFGLAFLTKGPPGLLPFLAILVFLMVRREWFWLRRLFTLWGLLVFAVTGLAWYLILILRTPNLLSYFLEYEVVARMASDVHGRHGEWYGGLEIYLPTLLLGSLPWTLLLLPRIPELRFSKDMGPLSWLRLQQPRWQFVATWLLIPLTVFMLSRSRLPLYVLPLFVPLSLVIAGLIPGDFARRRLRTSVLIGIVVVMLLGLKGYTSGMAYQKDARLLARSITLHAPGPYQELVFVDQKPRYGLRLYLGAEIEYVCMLESCPARGLVRDERLEDELKTNEKARLYLVPEWSKETFRDRMQQLGKTGRELGSVQGLELVEIY